MKNIVITGSSRGIGYGLADAFTLSPGMVVTKLVADQFHEDPAGLERVKTIFNLCGDSVETVAP